MSFKVTNVVDGDTFQVSPNWEWSGQTGNIVRASGYDTPERGQPGYEAAKNRLTKLILGKEVELKNVIKLTYGRLLCDVYLDGINIARYFLQHQRT